MNKSAQFVKCGDYVFLAIKALRSGGRGRGKARLPQELEYSGNISIVFICSTKSGQINLFYLRDCGQIAINGLFVLPTTAPRPVSNPTGQ